ncbi:MAG: XRE family transcriptional regulator [Alphaproteobacteria bacterium]|nr:MAG: XRE family transcriptional regulator [Alphaproteobacteria bacterium]TAF15648.1 MAG: XRE family transcriptional regulator [Alphaproteobacteria bacterium]TAF41085.1 MAG: XRE family transcriptional regulator [Alphaproteobacteria bacterium]TAF76189.1 MAG: XRE family transcriptional regulator [Alphaproteobacteria bacterium]
MSASPVDDYVGARLRARRIMLGLSQDMIGKKVGVSFQQVQKYERGINRIGSSRLYQFSKLLDVPISFFFEGYEQCDAYQNEETQYPSMIAAEDQHAFDHEHMSSRETLELVRTYYAIKDEKTRKRFLDLLKSFTELDQSA